MPSLDDRVLALEYAVAVAIYGGSPAAAKEQWDKDHAPQAPQTPGPQINTETPPHHQGSKVKKER